ncbi:chromate efflux transporter [Meridianimarinicoccus aquatilis]|uniref:Chromate efflux transporter n=1 Tax=Meridianimarinicoccus aquatilis TaxID=2552766 RepID=A0A4R6AZC8_9RHOB|nr:chromate efflux transporter [Fluviibacterium aquatile]TDL89195.1 chromate efflux transporter [Fluviibacterium aquatile]
MTPSAHSLTDLAHVFGRIGLLSFGGPAAQIALMHRELVENRRWMTEGEFLRAVSFCMLLPGPEAMQLATYAGWRLRGVPGGLIGGLLFVLPGALLIAALALLYGNYGTLPVVQAAFLGVKATVVVIVVQAVLSLARRTLMRPDRWTLAALSFVAIFALKWPFPVIILLAGAYGFATAKGGSRAAPPPLPPSCLTRTVVIWGGLWSAPIIALWIAGAHFLTDLALFFAKLALVTFGGAYAVLAYMTQTVVSEKGWIDTAQMIDALGLAETTPGPLILVTQFVGMLAGDAQGGPVLALLAGVLVLWVTFVPCFLWIFAGAPYVDWIDQKPRLSGALSAITAAVVGVILNLSVWFAAHVFFADIGTVQIGPLRVMRPVLDSFGPDAAALCCAAVVMIWCRWPLPTVLACAAVAGAGIRFTGLSSL